MHVRIAIQKDGTVKYFDADGDYIPLPAQLVADCFNGKPGSPRVDTVEVAGTAWETSPTPTHAS